MVIFLKFCHMKLVIKLKVIKQLFFISNILVGGEMMIKNEKVGNPWFKLLLMVRI